MAQSDLLLTAMSLSLSPSLEYIIVDGVTKHQRYP